MIVNCNDFKKTLDKMAWSFVHLDEKYPDPSELASQLSASSGVPLIVIVKYMMRIDRYKDKKELADTLKSAVEYYKPDLILDFEEEKDE